MKKDDIYKECSERWPVESQMLVLAEECMELAHVCLKLVNRTTTDERWDNFFEEIADVEIMTEQMRYIFGHVEIEDHKHKTLTKLSKKLEA